MFKAKQLGVAVTIALFSGAAMASNFRAADQVYVPAAGHASSSSATFVSDVFISNLTGDSVDVSVIYATGSNPQSSNATLLQFPKVITLLPNERRELPDFFVNTLHLTSGLGQLIFSACLAGGDCTPNISTGLNPNYRDISVESRIFSIDIGGNPATSPTKGQLFSGIPWYNYVSETSFPVSLDKVFITGIRNTPQYRTNMGFANGSQFSSTTITAKLFDGKTNNLLATSTFRLEPLGWVQTVVGGPLLFPGFPTSATSTNAYVTVEQGGTTKSSDADVNGCKDGCPAFLTYGSQVDNQTNDATTLEPQYLKRLTDTAQTCVYFPDQASCKAGGATTHRAVKHQF
jgi:hypothetical protein